MRAEKRIREQERAEGKVEGKAEAIIELIEDIGTISKELEMQIGKQKDPETVRKWLKLAAHSRSIEEFERLISESAEDAEASADGGPSLIPQ